jgi:hypothetical protein
MQPRRAFQRVATGCFAVMVLASNGRAAEVAPEVLARLPPPATVSVEFDRDVRPIFESACLRCHGPEKPKSGYRLDRREDAIKGGELGVAILPGDSAKSPLIHYVARLIEDLEMPPVGKGEPLTPAQIALLRAWIDQGAPWGATGKEPLQLSFATSLRFITVNGNEQKFREHYWQPEGWNGGIEGFELRDKPDDRTSVTATGRALRYDHRVAMEIERRDLGLLRFGWEQFTKFSGDEGGFQPGFAPPLFRLNRDLQLDIGRAWFDAGLRLPEWPRLTIGYEYQYREGEKSILQWGRVDSLAGSRNIYPTAKEIDEQTHVLKFDLEHDWRGWRIEENFRGEWTDLQTRRDIVTSFDPGAPGAATSVAVRERYQAFHGANTLRLERQFTDWLFGSGGYLYSKLDADSAFALDGVQAAPFIERWRADGIMLERESHVVNVNSLLGPWRHLTLSAGAQSEWTRQRALGDAVIAIVDPFLFEQTPAFGSNLDRANVQEHLLLRCTALPFSSLFAEARLEQETLGQKENFAGGNEDFLRDTDASGQGYAIRAGFNTSPWRTVSFNAQVRRHQNEQRYDHDLDEVVAGAPNLGYSAFIRRRETRTDEFEARLALRPVNWLRASLSYQRRLTDYRVGTDPLPDFGAGVLSPGGTLLAGDTDADRFGASLAFNLVRGLYLSTSFHYQQSRTRTAQNNAAAVADYEGDTFSSLTAASYALNARTALIGSYAFSRSDFAQNNAAAGQPAGIRYEQHAAQLGVRRQLNRNFAIRLEYALFLYDEPTAGGRNDYTAHGAFATLSYRMP